MEDERNRIALLQENMYSVVHALMSHLTHSSALISSEITICRLTVMTHTALYPNYTGHTVRPLGYFDSNILTLHSPVQRWATIKDDALWLRNPTIFNLSAQIHRGIERDSRYKKEFKQYFETKFFKVLMHAALQYDLNNY